jgi:two-component sensor histidine kinase
LGIPLGLIVAEFLTNAVKYANGDAAVGLPGVGDGRYALAVVDHGPGLPPAFDPKATHGLGMMIATNLVRDIRGELVVGPGDDGQGASFTVLFDIVAH